MSDIHALVGAYAIDALDDLERAAFERHLAECPACRAEVAGLREAAAMIGSTVPVRPSAGLRDRVLADIATVRPLPPPVDRPAAVIGRRTRFRPGALLAAAAAVIALGAGAVVVQPWDDDTSQRNLTASEQLLAADDAETYTEVVAGGGKATVVRSPSRNQAVLVASGLPRAPAGSVYELWLIHDGDMVSAGLMTGGDKELWLEGDPATASGFGITIEVEGGSPTGEPQGQPITKIDFQSA